MCGQRQSSYPPNSTAARRNWRRQLHLADWTISIAAIEKIRFCCIREGMRGGGSGFLSAACKSLWYTLCRLFNEDCVSQAVAAQAVCLAQGYWTRFVTLWMSARVWLITQLAYLILYCHAMLSLCQWSLPSEPAGLTPYFDAIPTKELCCSEPEDFQMWHRKRTLQGRQVPERKLCYRKWQLPFRRLHR